MAVRYDGERSRWVVEFEQAGVRVFRRLPQGATESQGKALETKLRREIFDRETLQKIPALTLEKAIEQWLAEDHRRKDRKKMASEARQWAALAKGKLLRDVPEVAQEAITEWTTCQTGVATAKRQQAAQKITDASATASKSAKARSTSCRSGAPKSSSAATINRRLAMLKAVCRHAYKQGRIAENLSGRITMLREDNGREVYLSRTEVMRLARASPTSACRTAIQVAAYTGLRASELIGLDSASVKPTQLVVRQSKTGKPRIVPVAQPVRPLLSSLPLPLSYWQLHKQFLVARKAAGLPYVRFHDLRHTCASWLINAGVDLYTVGKILGHSGPQTTARYAHLAHATLKDAMGRLK